MSHCGYFPEEMWSDHMKAEMTEVVKALEDAGHVLGDKYIMFAGGPDRHEDGKMDMFNSTETKAICARCGASFEYGSRWSSRTHEDDKTWSPADASEPGYCAKNAVVR